MLIIIHRLPPDTRYSDVKLLLKEKCGFTTNVILDKLESAGDSKKVTVGLADEGDAAILVRKINGLFVDGYQLYVEDVRKTRGQASEQPYRRSNQYQNPQDSMLRPTGSTTSLDLKQEVALRQQTLAVMKQMNTARMYSAQTCSMVQPQPLMGMAPTNPRAAANQFTSQNGPASSMARWWSNNQGYANYAQGYNYQAGNQSFAQAGYGQGGHFDSDQGYNQSGQNFDTAKRNYNQGSQNFDYSNEEASGSNYERGNHREDNFGRGNQSKNTRNQIPKCGYMNNSQARPSHDRGYENRGQSHDRGNQSYDRGNQSHDRGNQSYDRGNESYDSGNQDYDRGDQSYVSGDQTYDRGNQSYNRGNQSNNVAGHNQNRGYKNDNQADHSYDYGEQSRSGDQHGGQYAGPLLPAPPKPGQVGKKPFTNQKSTAPLTYQDKYVKPDPKYSKKNTTKQQPSNAKKAKGPNNMPKQNADKPAAQGKPNKLEDPNRGVYVNAAVLELARNLRGAYGQFMAAHEFGIVMKEAEIIINELIKTVQVQSKEHILKLYRSKYPFPTAKKFIKGVMGRIRSGNYNTPSAPKVLIPKKKVKKRKIDEVGGDVTANVFNDKEPYKRQKQMVKQEWERGADIYKLAEPLKAALKEECQAITDILKAECANPADEKETRLCNFMMTQGIADINKILELQVTKRILKIHTGLVAAMFFYPNKPKKPEIDAFLSEHGAAKGKKSELKKSWIVHFDDYDNYDRFVLMEKAMIGNVSVHIKPINVAGPKLSKSAKKKMNQATAQQNNQENPNEDENDDDCILDDKSCDENDFDESTFQDDNDQNGDDENNHEISFADSEVEVIPQNIDKVDLTKEDQVHKETVEKCIDDIDFDEIDEEDLEDFDLS